MKKEDCAIPENLAIRPSPIHGMGGFATGDLARGARVVEYTGRKITKAESLRLCEAGSAGLGASPVSRMTQTYDHGEPELAALQLPAECGARAAGALGVSRQAP